jgi:hypothetical protein
MCNVEDVALARDSWLTLEGLTNAEKTEEAVEKRFPRGKV